MSDRLLSELRAAWRAHVKAKGADSAERLIRTDFDIDVDEDGLDAIPDDDRQAAIDGLTKGMPASARGSAPKTIADLDVAKIYARFNRAGRRAKTKTKAGA